MRRAVVVSSLLLVGISAIAFLGIRLAGPAIHTSVPTVHSSAVTPTATSNLQRATPNPLICASPAIEWASLRSESPDDVLAAAKCTTMFQSSLHSNDPIAMAMSVGKIGQPVLVTPYTSGTLMDTAWVIPVVASSGYPLAMLEFVYDHLNHRLRAGSFGAVSNNMFYTSHPFPYISATQATSLVAQARHTSLMTGMSPELVYFYGSDHQAVVTGMAAAWTEGGDSAIDPMWRVPGADGRWYYVTPHDMRIRTAQDFPTMSDFPPIPQYVR